MELKNLNSSESINANSFSHSVYRENVSNAVLKKRCLNTNNNNNNNASVTKLETNSTEFTTTDVDISAICNLACTMRNNYINVLNKRKQDIFINSLLILIFCISPIAILPFYYCHEAGKQIKYENYEHVEFLLRRANYINITALIIGSVIYIGLLSVTLALLFSFYQRIQSCSLG
jgi:hypothetical protein